MRISLILLMLAFSSLLQAQEPPPARVVTAVVVEQELSPTSRMVGVLRFVQVAEVAAEVEGLITEHNFDTGWPFKQGEVMAVLNTDFVRKDIQISRAQIAEVEAEIEKLDREVKRLASLRRDNLASRSAYEEAFYSHKALLKRKDRLQRSLERMQIHLKKSQVRAPFNGIVLEKLRELGDWVDKGKPLARLGSFDGVQAVIPVSETLLPFQHAGAEFELFIPAMDRSFKGKLTGMVPFAELRSKSVYLKIGLPYEEGMIENLSVEAQVASAAPRHLRMIPRAALLQVQGAAMVYTIVEGKAVPVGVNIVARSGDHIAVDNPEITVGMAVVVDGNDRLRPGQPVQVVEQ
ncbi:efflux RND transporter periplasmic adaptor subunit [Pseudomonadota bacterium]